MPSKRTVSDDTSKLDPPIIVSWSDHSLW